jgi:uncharacterized membrane protein YfcA
MELYLLIGGLGCVTGFFSGLLGIGGGIIMAPLLLFVPPLLGFEPLGMRLVAGLTIVQGLVACVAGTITHHRFRFVSGQLTVYMGASIFAAAIIGGAAARLVSNELLLFVFACLALSAAFLMLLDNKKESESPDIGAMDFSRSRAVITAVGVGLFGGLVGQGGSFILIPLMTAFVKIPTRIAIGSNLAIVTMSTGAAFIGKAITGQIDWLLAVPVVITVAPATILGGLLSQRFPVLWLRRLLAFFIAISAIRIWSMLL